MNNKHNPMELTAIRQRVMANTQILHNLIPPTVSYITQGNVLIIGPEDLARLAAEQLSQMASLVILATDAITSQDDEHLEKVMNSAVNVECFYNKIIDIKGFLGQFQVAVEQGETSAPLSVVAIRKPHFDMILDLSQSPCLNLEMLPPGYFYVGYDQAQLALALAEIPELVGEFDKPRYVKVNADVCAHNRNGINGCNLCLNFCPADAISSQDHKIEIDPYLCHGAGSCTNACPTGAISYDLPNPQSLLTYLQKLIGRFSDEANIAPVVMFHDNKSEDSQLLQQLAGDVLPIALEEITVAAIDHWFAALAFGANQ